MNYAIISLNEANDERRFLLSRVVTLEHFFALIGSGVFLPGRTHINRSQALATTRNYPGLAPCNTTLQACINGSADGDAINIAAGFYITSFTLSKAVSLNGAGAGSTIIQALSNQRVMTVTGAMTSSTQIANLTVQGGNAGPSNGGGIYLLAGAQPLLQNINVNANLAMSGGGIYATSPITIVNVTIGSNAATLTLALMNCKYSVFICR